MTGPGHDIIAIGASAGGVEALTTLVRDLPPDLPAAVFVVLHLPPDATSFLPRILGRVGPLPAAHPTDGEPIVPGRIYVAPPDFHLLVRRGAIRVVRGPRENRHRPAVDPLFRSAAVTYGPRAVGVVLSGALDDGTAGLQAIKRRGGVAIVQDPEEALFPSMPASALQFAAVDHCLPLARIAPTLAAIAREPAGEEGAHPVPKDLEIEVRMAEQNPATMATTPPPGELSALTCPECRGPLWEAHDNGLLRFRCRVGHAFSAESMLAEQSEALEEALWTAVNTLEESALMAARLAQEARGRRHDRVAARFDERTREMQRRAELIRQVLVSGHSDATADAETAGK